MSTLQTDTIKGSTGTTITVPAGQTLAVAGTLSASGTVTVTAGGIATAELADDAVTVAKMAVNSVDSDQYVDASIDTAHIANDQITAALIADNAIDSDMYVDASIDTAHIGDAQVTLAKIVDLAANTVLVRDANSSGVASAKALATTEILIGDGTGFTAAALSGDVTMSNAGAVTIATDAVDIAMLSATGTASATTFLRGDNSWVAPTGGLYSSYAILADQKSSGTNGGTISSGAWRLHDLQTEIADPDSIVSISSNVFTLAAGNYLIKWVTTAYRGHQQQNRLSINGGAVVGTGGSGRTAHADEPNIQMVGMTRVTPGSSTGYIVEQRTNTTQTSTGFGSPGSLQTETYAWVEIYKET